MEWFTNWWGGLDGIEQVLFCIALPSTVILLIQTIMILFGFGHDGTGVNPSDTSGFDGSTDIDISTDVDISLDADASGADIDAGGNEFETDVTDVNYGDGSTPADVGTLNFFTVQGVISFFCVFGWAGIVTYTLSKIAVLAIIVGLILGLAAMYGVAKIMQLSKKLAQNGTLNIKNLLGASGTVYLVIPADGEGRGKVNVMSGERLVEFDAITDSGEALPDGTPIRVIDIRSGNVLVVEKV
ncbi:MAG: NfeD family protein [Ruminiclostridium sp.]|nr:NfeD family protein [Ruminiclostridium sp.]